MFRVPGLLFVLFIISLIAFTASAQKYDPYYPVPKYVKQDAIHAAWKTGYLNAHGMVVFPSIMTAAMISVIS
jgi:hypothetical protein